MDPHPRPAEVVYIVTAFMTTQDDNTRGIATQRNEICPETWWMQSRLQRSDPIEAIRALENGPTPTVP